MEENRKNAAGRAMAAAENAGGPHFARAVLTPEAERALSILEDSGYEAYLVGGCVRDWLMGISPGDYDITTDALPGQTRDLFAAKGFTVIETGIKHGTVTVLVDSIPLEITTYRVDGTYSDHRRPDSVAFTSKIEDDLARRDFTINALAWSPFRGFVDAWGGLEDLKRGVLRCVGEPALRFQEDALRIMRALRFSARYGFELEERTKAAVLSERGLLRAVSAERIFSELKKLLAGRDAKRVLMGYPEVLGTVVPELLPMVGFDQKNPHHIYDVWEHSVTVLASLNEIAADRPRVGVGAADRDGTGVAAGTERSDGPGSAAAASDHLRLAALLHDIGKPVSYSEDKRGVGHFYGHAKTGREIADEVLRRLRADTFTRERVDLLIQYHDTTIAGERRIVKRWLSRLGPEVFRELLLLKRADNMGQNRERFDRQPQYRRLQAMLEEILEEGECVSIGDLTVDGRDLMEAGIAEGPEIGRLLRLLLNAVMNGEAENDREALLAFLSRSRPE